MAATALTPVQFHGATLTVTTIDNVPFVAMRPICDAIGIDWQAQHARITRHPVLNSVVSVTKTTGADGKQYDMLLLPLDKLTGWLFGVSVRRVKPELRERLTQYQAECFDVLASHFGVNPPVASKPQPKPEPVTAASLVSLLMGDCLSHKALMDVAQAANMQIFKIATNNPNKGYGHEVAQRIKGLSDADLHVITVAATMETWMRTIQPAHA